MPRLHLLALINTDGSSPAVATARQSLGNAYLNEVRGAVARNDLTAADTWLNEARTIGFSGDALTTATADVAAAREKAAQRSAASRRELAAAHRIRRAEIPVVRAQSRHHRLGGTGIHGARTTAPPRDIVVTNSSPRRTFDNAAMTAVGQWRYKPVVARDGKPVEQRAAVRIRFSDE